jgi:hypothetical protein
MTTAVRATTFAAPRSDFGRVAMVVAVAVVNRAGVESM